MKIDIYKWIKDYVGEYHKIKDVESRWREPVIGVADPNNPKFKELKSLIPTTHFMPEDLLENPRSVIVFFLPFSEDIVKSNIKGIESSRGWDIANIETNNLILDINHYLHNKFKALGFKSTIMPATYNYDEKNLTSDWSHRHVGEIAGVGKFGINNILITERGCCGRMGSVITDAELIISDRDEFEYCLYKHNGSCVKCAKSCVVDAIGFESGKAVVDRERCNNQIYNDAIPEYEIGIGDACGKCMVGLPCSYINPVGKLLKR